MRRRRLLRAVAGGAVVGLVGCLDSDESEATPSPVVIELTPDGTPAPEETRTPGGTAAPDGTPAPAETPESTPTPEPEPTLEVESEHWEAAHDGQRYLHVHGSVRNPGDDAVEAAVRAAGWYGDDDCGADRSDAPDWEADPTLEVVVHAGVTWWPVDPWSIPLDRFDDCGYESPRVWVADLERRDE